MRNALFFFPSVLFLLFSCREQNSNISKRVLVPIEEPAGVHFPENNSLVFRDELSVLNMPSQVFWIGSESDTLLTGWKGTTLSIPKGCITHQDGTPVKGRIMIELKELFSKSDLVLNNKPTVSDRHALVSGGVVYVNARSEKENLIVQCPEGIQVSVPKNENAPTMELFLGELDAKGNTNWVKDSSLTPINMTSVPMSAEDSLIILSGDLIMKMPEYLFALKKFGWVNCDFFYSDPREKVNLVVSIPNGMPEDYSTHMFAVFKKQNTIIPLYTHDHEVFTSPSLPVGEEVFIVTLSGKDQRLFMDIQSTRIKKGVKEVVSLKESSKDEIKKRMEILN